MTNPLKGTHHHGNTILIQSGPIGLVCLLTAKACGAAHVIVTGEQCVTEWDGGWGLFVIVCVTEWDGGWGLFVIVCVTEWDGGWGLFVTVCVTEWDGGWGLFVIVCVTEWGIITGGHCDKTVMYLKEFVMLTNYPPVQTGHRLDSWTA